MVWWVTALWTVGLEIGTAILSALLNRGAGTDTKPGEPQFPKADAQAPIPVIYGTTRVGMNVVHLAGRTLGENTVRNGALSFGWSSTTIGKFYYVDLLAVLGWGPLGAIHEIYVDGVKKLSTVTARTPTLGITGVSYTGANGVSPGLPLYTELGSLSNVSSVLTITAGELLGGKLSRGGIGAGGDTGSTGAMRIWPGSGGVEHNARFETLHGAALPCYPHLITVALENDFYMGNSEQLPGIEFVVSRAVSWAPGMGTGYLGNNTANAGQPANVSGILYDLLTNTDYGLGLSSAELDTNSFVVLAHATDSSIGGTTAFDIGLSFVLDGTTTGKAVLADLLRTLDGVLAIDPETGLLNVWLLRAPNDPYYGYAGGTVVDESMIASLEWTDGLPDAQVNEVEVEFIDRARDYTKNTVTARNVAAIKALGRVEKRTVRFLGVQDADTAMRLAQRELRTTTTAMGRATIVTNRKGFNLMPGRSFSLTWSPRGFVGKTMRVVSVRDEHLGGVTIEAVEDVYSSEAPSFAVETTPEPTPPTSYPTLAPYGYLETSTSGTATGTAVLFLYDPSNVVTAVEYQTTSGTDTPSGWTADTFPYSATVTRDPYAPSTIDWRVTYTDAAGASQTLTFRATFDGDSDTLTDAVTTGRDVAAVVGQIGVPVQFVNVVEDDQWLALSTIPTAETEVGAEYRQQSYTQGVGSVRIGANIKAKTGSPTIGALYTTNSFGATAALVSFTPSSTGVQYSGWTAMPSGAKPDIGVTFTVGAGADTAALDLYRVWLEYIPTTVSGAREHSDEHAPEFS